MHDFRVEQEILQGKRIGRSAEKVWRWDSPTGRIRSSRRANYFIAKGVITHESNVLELGCGTGLFTRIIYERTKATINAIDISEELIYIAKEKYDFAKFSIMNAEYLNFDSNQFDVVFGSSVLHHLNYRIALKEVYRVLKPGGRMIFAEPNMLNPHIFLQKKFPFLKRHFGDCPHETAFTRWQLAKTLNSLGFSSIEVVPYDFLYPLIPDFSISFVNRVGKYLEWIPIIKEIAGSLIIFSKK